MRALALIAALAASAPPAPEPPYDFTVERAWLSMPDGVRLSVTYWRPVPRRPDERFPVLFELLPYRKDDNFYRRDWPLYSWFVRRGYILAKVDVRGTGSSEGVLPSREYSDEEIADAVETIAQLARLPSSSGAVGMWGISWGGFNALKVAMRRPPALKAILAFHSSDDLYRDDVRYIDGVLHIDPYALQIDHENGLPRPPDYPLDAAYIRDRFDREPWIFTYLRHPSDGEFWRRGTLRWDYGAIQVPTYLVGGLLDGYRDPVLRMLDSLRAPVKAEIGPWMHDWPDNGIPGPNYEWRLRAVEWWDHWLKGRPTTLLHEPCLLVFVRAGQPPDALQTTTDGEWRFEDWPIRRTMWRTLYPAPGGTLRPESAGQVGVDSLRYVAGSGTAAGDWWGDPTGDMARDDANALTYDGAPLEAALQVIGFPRVRLQVSASAPLAHWTVRLEDVSPAGDVTLVTAAAINGVHARSTLEPARLAPGVPVDLAFDLHFTTWTFRPGHRVRLAVSNAQFPMLWPTPYPMTTTLARGEGTSLALPEVPPDSARGPVPSLPEPERRDTAPDARSLEPDGPAASQRVIYDPIARTTTVEWISRSAYGIRGHEYRASETEVYETSDANPATSSFRGDAVHAIRLGRRRLELRTRVELQSDTVALHLTFTRTLLENRQTVRTKRWVESFPRTYH